MAGGRARPRWRPARRQRRHLPGEDAPMSAARSLLGLALVAACGSPAPAQSDPGADAGATLPPCAAADQAHGSLGCEFFAADLSNQFELVHGLTLGTPPCGFL